MHRVARPVVYYSIHTGSTLDQCLSIALIVCVSVCGSQKFQNPNLDPMPHQNASPEYPATQNTSPPRIPHQNISPEYLARTPDHNTSPELLCQNASPHSFIPSRIPVFYQLCAALLLLTRSRPCFYGQLIVIREKLYSLATENS
jgi:hypothetical protein